MAQKINSVGSESPRLTPLQEAASRGDLLIVQYLVAHGADVMAEDDMGATALHAADEDSEVVQFLVAKGADPNAKDFFGDSPLHSGNHGVHKKVAITTALLSAGANINAKNANGETPIVKMLKKALDCEIWFTLGEALPNIDTFVRAGANLSIADEEGNSALSLARDIQKNCGRQGQTAEENAAARSAVSALARILSRAPSQK